MASIADTLHDEIVTRLTALSLGAPVLKRKLPSVTEEIDDAPALFVTPADVAGEDVPFSTEEKRKRTYVFQVVRVTRSDRDNLTGLPAHHEDRQAIQGVFGPSLPLDLDEFLSLKLTPGPVIDRAAYSKLYDYDSVCAVWVSCVEDA